VDEAMEKGEYPLPLTLDGTTFAVTMYVKKVPQDQPAIPFDNDDALEHAGRFCFGKYQEKHGSVPKSHNKEYLKTIASNTYANAGRALADKDAFKAGFEDVKQAPTEPSTNMLLGNAMEYLNAANARQHEESAANRQQHEAAAVRQHEESAANRQERKDTLTSFVGLLQASPSTMWSPASHVNPYHHHAMPYYHAPQYPCGPPAQYNAMTNPYATTGPWQQGHAMPPHGGQPVPHPHGQPQERQSNGSSNSTMPPSYAGPSQQGHNVMPPHGGPYMAPHGGPGPYMAPPAGLYMAPPGGPYMPMPPHGSHQQLASNGDSNAAPADPSQYGHAGPAATNNFPGDAGNATAPNNN